MEQTDVIIAGGGPVGLCLALLLTEQNIAVTIIEADAEPARDLRASTFHPPTMDMLDRIGITDELLAGGLPCPNWQIRLHPTGDRAVFDLGVLADETNHPYRLQCEQWKLADALRARLAGRATLLPATRLQSFTQDDDGVTIDIEHAGETRQLRAKFLAGCDGARSTVRATLALPFEGATYPETTILVTTLFPFEQHLEGLSNVTYCWREGAGNFSLLRVPNRWRVSLYPREDTPLEAQMTPAAIEASLQEIIPNQTQYAINETRPYRVHMRIVDRYNVGRVALAGDAAHLNSPSGGMGLNGGLHDAFELADTLTQTLHGATGLLDRYDRRRRPVAQDEILAQADRNRARMREKDPERRKQLLKELQEITGDKAKLKDYLMKSSMINGLKKAQKVS